MKIATIYVTLSLALLAATSSSGPQEGLARRAKKRPCTGRSRAAQPSNARTDTQGADTAGSDPAGSDPVGNSGAAQQQGVVSWLPGVLEGTASQLTATPTRTEAITPNPTQLQQPVPSGGGSGGNPQGSNGCPVGKSDIKDMQVTVTGYGPDCVSKAMACTWLGADTHGPTAAMSGYLIKPAGQGVCGTCWRITNAHKTAKLAGKGVQGALIANSKANTADGMVVMVNNACASDPNQPDGQCNQTPDHPIDNFNSRSVLDLCSGTDAVQQFFGSPKPSVGIANATKVDCSEWSTQPVCKKWH